MEEYRRWEDNIKMDLKEIGVNVRSWLDSIQDRDWWRGFLIVLFNLRVPQGVRDRDWRNNVQKINKISHFYLYKISSFCTLAHDRKMLYIKLNFQNSCLQMRFLENMVTCDYIYLFCHYFYKIYILYY